MKKGLNYYNCICKNYSKSKINISEVKKCNFCGLYSHNDCLPYLNMSSKEFICPECQLLLLNPLSRFQLILLYPSLLTVDSGIIYQDKNKQQKNIFKFKIPSDFFLFESSDNNQLLNVFIVIYCLKLEGKGFKNEWPLNTTLYINESNKKFLGCKKGSIDNNKRYLPLIFSYNSQNEYFLKSYFYINSNEQNFMVKNIFGLVKDCFIQGENIIRFSFEDSNPFKNENNLYVITIRREYFITPEYAVNILLQNSYITFYEKKKLKIKPEFKKKEMKEKLFEQEFRSKGLFCKHKELFDVFKLLKKYYNDGNNLICPLCNEIIGYFRIC